MRVLVVVIDDNENSQTFQLEKVKEAPNFIRFEAREKDNPLTGRPPIYSKTHVIKGFKAANKS